MPKSMKDMMRIKMNNCVIYRAFHRFGPGKFPDGGLVLGSSLFSVLPQLPPKTVLSLKEDKID